MKISARILFALGSLAFGFSFAEAKEDVSTLSNGNPKFMSHELPASSYVEVEAKRFKNAKVVWINFDWLREHGIEFPREGLTPEFEKHVLDALAYGIPGQSQDNEQFIEMIKKFFADHYGGIGIGSNFGSGRAASAGLIQIKGIGVTPLVGGKTTFDHAHGGASLEESIREAKWGEVNHRELPYGSNRVLAIIDSGADTVWKDGTKEKRALIIREDPLRPAHLMHSPWGSGVWSENDKERALIATKNAQVFFQDLIPKEVKGTDAALDAGFKEYVKRVAVQYGTTYPDRLFHGATSHSNIDSRGFFLDFGTETQMRSYQPVYVISHVEPFGEMGDVKKILVSDILSTLKDGKAPGYEALPSDANAWRLFDYWYHKSKRAGMLKLTGAPAELLQNPSLTASSEKLNDALDLFTSGEFRKSKIKKVIMDRSVPAAVKPSKLGQVLEKFAAMPAGSTGEAYLKVLSETSPQLNQKTAKGLAEAYAKFSTDLHQVATAEHVSAEALQNYMRLGSHKANQQFNLLERPTMIENGIKNIEHYVNTGDRSTIWNDIDHTVDFTKTTFLEQKPYQLVLDDRVNHLTGEHWQRVFDLKSNAYHDVYVSADEEAAWVQKRNLALAPKLEPIPEIEKFGSGDCFMHNLKKLVP